MSAGHGTKAIIAAFFANLGIAIAKFVGFVVTGSSSLLAEGVHSVADTGNQALLFLGTRRGGLEPTPTHQFGYGRERYFWSFVVALVLFSLGSLFALYEGIEKIRHPHELESLQWAMGILVFGIVLEGFSFRTAVVESQAVRGDRTWWEFVRSSRAPELPVVLLEDLGALVGLVIALGAVSVAEVTGEPVWDGIGTVSIGVLLGAIAVVLAIEMKSMLIGESASGTEAEAISSAIVEHPAVDRVVHARTQYLGPDELLVSARVCFADELGPEAIPVVIGEIEREIRSRVAHAEPIYIEPAQVEP